MKVVVVDYQLGNISSIINMLKKIDVDAFFSSNAQDISRADKLILPGVGAFDHGMQNLKQAGLIDILNEAVLSKKKPILGICLGMQLLLEQSEEGKELGLGWVKGKSVKFKFENKTSLKVPHMGWNVVQSNSHSFGLDAQDARFYFVHSYHVICDNPTDVLGTTFHGYEFPSIIKKDHILGVQFHPEKSHRYGMAFLKHFIESPLC